MYCFSCLFVSAHCEGKTCTKEYLSGFLLSWALSDLQKASALLTKLCLCSDCFDSKAPGQEPTVDNMSQLNANFRMPAFNNRNPFHQGPCAIAPTRVSAAQLLADDLNPHNMHERMRASMHESPKSQSPRSPHTSPPTHAQVHLDSAEQCRRQMHALVGAPMKAGSLVSCTGTDALQHAHMMGQTAANSADCNAEEIGVKSPSRDSPSSCDPSTSGGSTRFKAPFPWAGSQPIANSLHATPANSTAATSSRAHIHGSSPSASFHSMHANLAPKSHDDLGNTAFRMCSRELSVKAASAGGADSSLPDVSRAVQNAINLDVTGPSTDHMHARWNDAASHAVLSSAASALLGFYPSSADMHAPVAQFGSLPSVSAAASGVPSTISFQPSFAFNASYENMHAFPPCGNSVSGTPCGSPRTTEGSQHGDTLAFHAPVSGGLLAPFSCDKLSGCAYPHACGETFNPIDSLMDMEPSAAPDLLFESFKHW